MTLIRSPLHLSTLGLLGFNWLRVPQIRYTQTLNEM
jgi:hypothetical protein